MTVLEREYRYLIRRAIREHNTPLAEALILGAMKHNLDLAHLLTA